MLNSDARLVSCRCQSANNSTALRGAGVRVVSVSTELMPLQKHTFLHLAVAIRNQIRTDKLISTSLQALKKAREKHQETTSRAQRNPTTILRTLGLRE